MTTDAVAVTDQIARFALEADVAAGPAALREAALSALIDTIGVAIAGRNDSGFRALLEGTREEIRPGPATMWATGQRTSPAYAALVNGTAAHALDYDDVSDPMYGHPSVALYPSLVAVAQAEGSSGAELLDAYVVGFEITGAIASALPILPHYYRGWHSTATVGVLASTAAICRLLHLDIEDTRRALGIAASTASGSRQNFGTNTKPLHPGLSSWSAVTAARLAQSGFTADDHQLEAPLGYFAMYGTESDLSAVAKWLDQRWAILAPAAGVSVKKYPCCYNTHRSADATLDLAAEIADPGSISGVRVTVEPGGLAPVIHHRPITGLEGKFSVEYVVAAGLLDRRVRLATFTDEAVARPEAQALLRKVEVAESPTPPFGEAGFDYQYSAVEIDTGDTVLRRRVDIPSGHSRDPLAADALEEKFLDCVSFSAVPWDGAELIAALRSLPTDARLDAFDRFVEAPLPA
ncbi:MAG: MmgE/PrpD family protein [Acidimicrobiaceae bacterium]|nr:MmgE/PrpD family protein [Acidimicrobiaceae bacterium]